ncbi:nucleoside diphosphate-linked moiety X motif 8 [Heterodontus francisci]|uniref:nucleoside diphosphate-linked moiety X motif 8 n=1 Tax=Heterodontus francisci TaxID=7792 RepID=UPI00355BE9B0
MLCRFAPLAMWARRSSGRKGNTEGEEGVRGLPSPDAIRCCLSEANERRCRAQLGRSQEEGKSGRPTAGVLVPLCLVQGDPSLLLTLRSSKLRGRHKGDVSFPGGKCESSDRDIIDTALRETHEELGFRLAPEHVWGTLKPLSDWSGMVVVPVLANLGALDLGEIRPDPKEVEDVFAISIQHLCSEVNRGSTHFRGQGAQVYTLPVFLKAKYKVWGMTAVMIDGLLSLLFPGAYRSTVRGSRPKVDRSLRGGPRW